MRRCVFSAVLCPTRRWPPIDPISLSFTEFLMSKIDLDRRSIVQALAALPAKFIDPKGLGAYTSGQVYGIAYNTEKIKQAPTSWNDLLKPQFKGRVGLVGLDSTLGLVWMVALAKMLGGDEAHMDPAFDFVRRLMPNVGAVAPNPAPLATLFHQGPIDI